MLASFPDVRWAFGSWTSLRWHCGDLLQASVYLLSRGMRELFPQAAGTITAVCGPAAECTSRPP